MSRPASSPAIGKNPIVATDADIAGRVAAERDFWLLTPYRLDPRYALLPEGTDPADLLALNGPEALTTVLDQARAARRTAHRGTAHQPATRTGPTRGGAGPRRPPPGMLGPGQQHHQLPPQRSPGCGTADPARPREGVEPRSPAGCEGTPAGR